MCHSVVTPCVWDPAFSSSLPSLRSLVSPVSSAFAAPDITYNSFEFPDMRNVDLTGMLVMQPGGQPNQPPGVCLGTLGSGVCTGFVYNHDPARVQIVNDPANCHSGSWCARVDLPAGALGNAEMLESGYTPGYIGQGCSGSSCYTYHAFYRYWIKWASSGFTVNSAAA